MPWISHDRGALDGFIDDWHGWFGFPDGYRDQVPPDQLDFRYIDNGNPRIDRQRGARGFGDLRLLAGWQLRDGARSQTALRASIKLPTGDSARLTGSGAADFAIGLAGDFDSLGQRGRWRGWYRADVVLVGTPDRLADRARRVIGKLHGGIGYAAHPRLTLSLQASLRSAAWDSSIRVLGDPAMQLNAGGTIRIAERLRLRISVGEDVRVNTAPDVTLGLTLAYRPAD